MKFHIIGIGNKTPQFTLKQNQIIADTNVFSGGKRHYELVKAFLPENHEWIFISSPMEDVFQQYEAVSGKIIVFASGNPLFYGFSNTLRHKYPKADIITEPYFSAIQLLASKTNTKSNQLVTVSVHGRDWTALDAAIMKQLPLIGVLTDAYKNPKTIAERLLGFGYDNYTISIGEAIEGKDEHIQTLSLQEATSKTYHPLNCILLHKQSHRKQSFGIPDKAFTGLEGRPNMITKMPIRLTTLHLLDILNKQTLWDIGFCTGSVSIEAKLKNPNLNVIAFEKRLECEAILKENQKRFGVMGIQAIMGDVFHQNLENLSTPDTVFIGGHGGRLEELLNLVDSKIEQGGVIVINAVQEQSSQTFIATAKNLGWQITEDETITVNLHNPIRLLKAIKH